MPRPRKSEKPLPPELLDQLPRILNQTSFCDDELEKLAQDCEEEEGPINNDHLYSERYLSLRESAWAKWEQYCSMSGYDKEASWIDYAQNSYDGHTQKPFRSFLRWYVKQSRRHVLKLDEQESQPEKGITTVSSLQLIWKYLTTYVDQKLMRAKRISDPEHAHIWDMSWKRGQDRQPAHQIMQVCLYCLRPSSSYTY